MDNKTHILSQYLSGELSVEEMTVVEEKILTLQEWKEEFLLLQQIFSVAQKFEYPESSATNKAWLEFSEKTGIKETKIQTIKPRLNWWKYAAVIALLFAASVGVYNQFFDGRTEWSSNDARIIKQLPDGSWVVLEPKSTVEFNADHFKQNRSVWLRGTVHLMVAKDKQHPFEVLFREGKLKVTGTRFMLKEDRNASLVSLFSGSLTIFTGNSRLQIKPGQTVSVKHGKIPLITESISDPVSEIFSLNFKDASLSEIIKGLENRFDVLIKFPEKLKEQHYTVQAEGLELDDVLNVLAELTGTVVQKYPDYFELKF